MTIAAHTLGCKLNFAETSHIVRQFVEGGWQVVGFDEVADLYVVNTCTVTAIAEKKCRTAIRQATRRNPGATVAVIGCFAHNAAAEVASIPGVSIVLDNNDKHRLYDYVNKMTDRHEDDSVFPIAYSSGDRTRSFLKVQDGCDYFCTYCAIPFARGRSKSATVKHVVDTAQHIAALGVKEIVLTGVNTGTFGLHNGETFLQLLMALDEVEGIERYRISSIEPNLISDDIIRFVARSRAFLPHFHIPLQAGSDKLLAMMHRHYDTALYAAKLSSIKELMPDACIAADIMAGFNGEDEAEFEKVCRFVEALPISYLHIFTYSDRPNTAALRLGDKIPMHIRRQHSEVLHEISNKKRKLFYDSQQGQCRKVLWESTCHGNATAAAPQTGTFMQGWTDNYIRLQRPFDESLVNTITNETIDGSTLVYNFPTND